MSPLDLSNLIHLINSNGISCAFAFYQANGGPTPIEVNFGKVKIHLERGREEDDWWWSWEGWEAEFYEWV